MENGKIKCELKWKLMFFRFFVYNAEHIFSALITDIHAFLQKLSKAKLRNRRN